MIKQVGCQGSRASSCHGLIDVVRVHSVRFNQYKSWTKQEYWLHLSQNRFSKKKKPPWAFQSCWFLCATSVHFAGRAKKSSAWTNSVALGVGGALTGVIFSTGLRSKKSTHSPIFVCTEWTCLFQRKRAQAQRVGLFKSFVTDSVPKFSKKSCCFFKFSLTTVPKCDLVLPLTTHSKNLNGHQVHSNMALPLRCAPRLLYACWIPGDVTKSSFGVGGHDVFQQV